MRKLLGLVLAIIGIVFGRAAYENAPTHREDQLAAVTRILTNPSVDSSPLPLSAVTRNAPRSLPTATALPVESTSSVAIARPETGAIPATTTWQTSVNAEAAHPGSTAAVTSATPGDNSARFELVRSIQTELKRLGCYGGVASGNWTSNSKRAMSAFLDRINANLPVEQPDYIQLTLLQGQNGSICGRDCPKGQSQADNGRCLPNVIVARAAEKKSGSPNSDDWSDKTTVQVASVATAKNSSKSIDVAAAEQLPWAEKTATADPIHRPSTAGRMSVGGPLPDDVVATSGEKLARLHPAEAPVSSPDDQAALNSEAAPSTQGTDLIADPQPQRSFSEVAAVSPEDLKQGTARALSQPKVRVVVPRSYSPRPARAAAARPSKTRLSSYRPSPSLQSVFTHPLGRL